MPDYDDAQSHLVRELAVPLYAGKGWIKLVAVLAIAYGVLTALSIVGLIIAWLPIWLGVVLYQSATAVEEAQLGGQKEALLRAQAKLRTYFTIMGVLTLIGLIFTTLGLVGGMFGMVMHGFNAGIMGGVVM